MSMLKIHTRIKKNKMASPHQSADLADNIIMWEDGGKKGLTLNTRAINIIWGGDGSKGRYWKRRLDGPSEVVELVGVCWLEVSGKVPLQFLSPKTTYRFFINLELTSDGSDWSSYPIIFKLQSPGNIRRSKEVILSEYLNRGWADVPDEGLEFYVPEDNSGKLTFIMYEIENEQWKKGLVIKEVKLVPKTNFRSLI